MPAARPASRSPAKAAAHAPVKSTTRSPNKRPAGKADNAVVPALGVQTGTMSATGTQEVKTPEAAKTAKSGRASKAPKGRRKPVRDSFTMPEADFALIATLKARALAARRETKKSELLRAGLQALMAMDSAALLAALQRLEPVKVGRPKVK